MIEQPKCVLCGEPMPAGEEVFQYHGYSGPCPPKPTETIPDPKLQEHPTATRRASDVQRRNITPTAEQLEELEQRHQDLLAENIIALKAACRHSHSKGPGVARICVCGAGGGGSKACNALAVLRDLVRYGTLSDATMNTLRTYL